jgi:ParB/RepB/Spo0J family partition protein
MAAASSPTPEELPASYDELMPISQLRHGEHNPRRVRPRSELIQSIEQDGLQRPLIVRPNEKEDCYDITDGWQRYQAATQLGWEELPVVIYETALSALEATEMASIVREWSPYDWAQYCGSLAEEVEASSHSERANAVADRVTKSRTTVERYLAALSLPTEVHPLLPDGPDGSPGDWQALANYNEDIRRYGDLSWVVAAKLGREYRKRTVSTQRTIELAANAIAYERETGKEFVERGCKEPELPLSTLKKLSQQEASHQEYLRVPGVTVPMSKEKKQELMEHCAETRTPLSALVTTHLQEFAEELRSST